MTCHCPAGGDGFFGRKLVCFKHWSGPTSAQDEERRTVRRGANDCTYGRHLSKWTGKVSSLPIWYHSVVAGWLIKKNGSQVAKEGFEGEKEESETDRVKLSTMSRSAVVAGWPIRKWWLKERRVWGNKRNETEDTRLDDVKVSTHRWWLFTAMACLKLGDLLNK